MRCPTGPRGGFRRDELVWLAIAMVLLIAFPFTEMPLGVGSTLIAAALIVRCVVNPTPVTQPIQNEMPAPG